MSDVFDPNREAILVRGEVSGPLERLTLGWRTG